MNRSNSVGSEIISEQEFVDVSVEEMTSVQNVPTLKYSASARQLLNNAA